MKQYRITVNGVAYDVTVEETASVATAPVAAPVPAPAPAAAPAAPVGANAVKAPMPGTINAVRVKVGDAVKKGDVLMVLEAMKMENDICAPADGRVASIDVAQGATVSPDQVLLTLN